MQCLQNIYIYNFGGRKQEILIAAARLFLEQPKLPLTYWAHALEHFIKGRNFIVHTNQRESLHTLIFLDTMQICTGVCEIHATFWLSSSLPYSSKEAEEFEGCLNENLCRDHIDLDLYKALTTTRNMKTRHIRFFESTVPGHRYSPSRAQSWLGSRFMVSFLTQKTTIE